MYHQPAYHQPAYVDANGPCFGVGGYTTSASSSYPPYNYEQKPVEESFVDYRQRNLGSHASASPDCKSVNNMGYPIDQHGTPYGQKDVSRLYPSAAGSQYLSRPMDGGIGYADTSYLAGYSQPAYTAPHVTNQSAPSVGDICNSAHLQGYG